MKLTDIKVLKLDSRLNIDVGKHMYVKDKELGKIIGKVIEIQDDILMVRFDCYPKMGSIVYMYGM